MKMGPYLVLTGKPSMRRLKFWCIAENCNVMHSARPAGIAAIVTRHGVPCELQSASSGEHSTSLHVSPSSSVRDA